MDGIRQWCSCSSWNFLVIVAFRRKLCCDDGDTDAAVSSSQSMARAGRLRAIACSSFVLRWHELHCRTERQQYNLPLVLPPLVTKQQQQHHDATLVIQNPAVIASYPYSRNLTWICSTESATVPPKIRRHVVVTTGNVARPERLLSRA